MDSLNKLEEMIKSFPPSFGLVKTELLNQVQKVKEEFEDFDSRSVSWSVADFRGRAQDIYGTNWKHYFDPEKFDDALGKMISKHDASLGISWDTVDYYLDEYCKK